MASLSAPEVHALAVGAGFVGGDALTMTVIAWFESGWDPANVGDQTLSEYGSRGLWQIFTGAHTPAEFGLGNGGWSQELIARLSDPTFNAGAAFIVWREQGFRAWSTYNDLNGDAQWRAKMTEVEAATAPKTLTGDPDPVPDPQDRGYLDHLGNRWVGAPGAVARANIQRECAPDLCLKNVRTWLQVQAGAPTAIAAWRAVPSDKRHNWYTPPAGVPVFWSGGSHGAGHVALSLGGGEVRSTDIRGRGTVATVSIDTIAKVWGLTYLGWAENLNGVTVYERGAA